MTDGKTRCTCGAGHETFGACLRAKNLRIGFCGIGGQDRTRQQKWDAELSAYKAATAQGIQPAGTTMRHVREAVELSNKVGKAFDATSGSFT